MIKHKVYKFSGCWYGMCAECPHCTSQSSRHQTINELEEHAKSHKAGAGARAGVV